MNINQKSFAKILLTIGAIIIVLVIAYFALIINIQRTTPTPPSWSFTGDRIGNRVKQVALDTATKKFWAEARLYGGDDINITGVDVDLYFAGQNFAEVPVGSEYIANIYKGSCDNSGSIKYFLSNIKTDNKGTVSRTVLETSLNNLLAESPLSIKLYKRSNFLIPILVRYANKFITPLACGDIWLSETEKLKI